jgi:hypothetical protein
VVSAPAPLHPGRRALFDRAPEIAGVPAAQVAVEHLSHHGKALTWEGSSAGNALYATEHRFRCADPDCRTRVVLMVDDLGVPAPVQAARAKPWPVNHVAPDHDADLGTEANHFCMTCGLRVGRWHVEPQAERPEPPRAAAVEEEPPPVEEKAPAAEEHPHRRRTDDLPPRGAGGRFTPRPDSGQQSTRVRKP